MKLLKLCLAMGCVVLTARGSFAGDAQWVEVRSPNFSVITDAGDKRGREVALHFEQMRSVFGTLMTKAHVSLAVPLQIVAFRSSKEMRQMAPIFNGKPTEDAGLFQGGQDRSFIMLDMSVENPWSVVFHEYAHQLMDGNLPVQADPWFEEGFAEFFASIEVDSKQARVGKIPDDTYRILQQEGMMHVADLFRVQQYSKTYNENGSHRSVFYAQSSLVVHYIYDNKLIPKAADYFELRIDQKKPVEQSIQQAFGMTAEQFDKVLRDYLASGRYRYYAVPTPAGIVEAQFTVTPVSPVEARALIADIHAHSPDYRGKAAEEFEEILKTDPENAAALRGLGFAYLEQKDFPKAAEYLRRAVAQNSKDARVHFYYALLLNQQGGGDAASKGEIKKELETSISLDPTLADAYSLLGFTQAFSGEPEKGLATMKKAVELSPRNETYQLNLASVYLANRKPEEAIPLLTKLAGSTDPNVAANARANLAQAQMVRQWSNKTGSVVESGPRLVSQPQETAGDSEPAHSEPDHGGTVEGPTGAPSPTGPIRFIKGRLSSVDCATAPQALLIVTSHGRSLKLHISDTKHVVLLGADNFSCDWSNKDVALNYRDRKDGDGDVVSLEIQ
jgi:tetratricopeptide (TPR) repeat protein